MRFSKRPVDKEAFEYSLLPEHQIPLFRILFFMICVNTSFFYNKNFCKIMSLKNFKKTLRKSPASNAGVAIFKNVDSS